MIDDNGGKGYTRKPKGFEVARCRNRMRLETCDPASLILGISKGYAWMPGVMKGGMCREDWQSQQLIALDFDNKSDVLDENGKPLRDENNRIVQRALEPGDEGFVDVSDALKRMNDSGIVPMAAYATYSSTAEHPKFRIVVLLDEPCEDPDVMELAIDRLLYLFPEADQSCKDLARLFFGTGDESSVISFIDSKWAPTDIRTVLALPARPAVLPHRKPLEKPLRMRKAGGGYEKVNLAELKENADLLGMIQADVGESGHKTGRYIEFHNCPICGHKDCFRYYMRNNTWTCFSDSNTTGRRGGSVIDYVMARDGVDVGAAIAALAVQVCGGRDD